DGRISSKYLRIICRCPSGIGSLSSTASDIFLYLAYTSLYDRPAAWRASRLAGVSVSDGPSPGVPVRASSFPCVTRVVFSPSTLPLVVMPQLLDGDLDFSGFLPVTRLLYANCDLLSLSSPS